MAKTENLELNIVEESDFSQEPKPLVDWDKNITENFKILDNFLKDFIDSKWNNGTLSDNFTAYNNNANNNPKYRKIGKIVELRGIISPANSTNELNSASEIEILNDPLPEEYRPSLPVYRICQGTKTNIWLLIIKTDGRVFAARYRSETEYSETSPAITTWMPFNIVYFLD